MDVEEFDSKLKESFQKFDLKDKEYLSEILLLKPKGKVKSVTGDFLIDLYNNYVLNGRTIGFDFNNKLREEKDFLFFASMDPFDIGIDKASGKVIIWDSEWVKIHHVLAPDLDTFLQVVIKIYEYGLPSWFENKRYTVKDRLALFEQIEKMLDAEYLTYYTESYKN